MSVSELLLMPRNRNLRRWDATAGAGLAAGKRRRRPVTRSRSWEHRAPGFREHPPRSDLGRVERDNPVGVRALPGKPTVREAQLPGGRRMVREANAGGRKATGNRDSSTALSGGGLA